MRTILLAAFFTFLCCLNGRGQNCLPGIVLFDSQVDIDSFASLYPGCTVIEGEVEINGTDITNLNGLSQLSAIESSLTINYLPLLTSLHGLDNVKTIGGDLDIRFNEELTNLSGLDNIEAVGGSLYISNNYALANLHGMENISAVGGDLWIEGNHALTSASGPEKITTLAGGLNIQHNSALPNLNGLENIKSVGGDLFIYGNSALTSLNGLEGIIWVGGALSVQQHPELSDLNGLGNIVSVGSGIGINNNSMLENLSGLEKIKLVKYLGIQSNLMLTSLSGLEGIEVVEDGIQIAFNPLLTSLSGLYNLSSIGEGAYVNIFNNQSLSDCAIYAVCDYLFGGGCMGCVGIEGNAPGCNSGMEVESQCGGVLVEATVQRDNNGNCLPDTVDLPVPGIQVRLSGNAQTSLHSSGLDGVARLKYFDAGPFYLHLPKYPTSHWSVCQDTVLINPVPGSQDTIKTTILLSPLTQCPELTATLGLPSNFRGCLVNTDVQVAIQNTGSVQAEGVQAAVVLPPVLEVIASKPPSAAQNGDTLFFELGDMAPFATKNIKLTVKTGCDTFLFGHTLCVEIFAGLDNSCPDNLPGLSEVKLSAQCIGDSLVRFYLKNIGEAPTQGPYQYAVIKNENIIATGGFSLDVQETLTVDVPADGATFRMEATKFDDGTLTAIAIENCRELTPGLITAFWLDRGAPDYDFDCRQVIGSYDPNQKTAVPTGTGSEGLIVANHPLQYTIDFQNTGADTAFRVLLRDLLPLHLDINTFRPGFSSHPCTWEINGHRLEVLFSPIALPDSNVNEPASHGFFSFTIDQKPDLPDGTNLENTASIIFDFNPPIVTNTVRHTIGQLTVRVDEARPFPNLWRVWGNPLRDAATFRTEEFVAGEKRFELYDAAGRLVRSAQFSGQTFEFQRGFLPGGLYFFRISDAQGRVFAGKIVAGD